MKKQFWLCALAPLATLAACGQDSQAQEVQVVVAVSADALVGGRLARLDANLFADTGDLQALHAQRFSIGSSVDATAFPFSFVIARPAGTRARLELLGYEGTNASPVVEHKAIVTFEASGPRTVSLRLSGSCLDRICASVAETCAPSALTSEAGCVPITLAGDVDTTDPMSFHGDAAIGSADAGLDASADAGLDASPDGSPDARASVPEASQDNAPDASVALPAWPVPACPENHGCTVAHYPCLASDNGAGYSCQGQYAAWPMPDSSPGAKVAPRYSLSTEGVVQDEVTGLAWQSTQPSVYAGCTGRVGAVTGDTCTWAEAKHYCAQLALAGASWRLPSKIELESLLDFTKSPTAIDPMYFPGTSTRWYWSIARDATPGYADSAWTVHFAQRMSVSKADSTSASVRCVRSQRAPNAPPTSRFSRAPGVVRDAFTTLEWSDALSPSAYDHVEQAAAFCAASGERFRVPTGKELLTLMDVTREVATDPKYFPQYDSQSLWLLWSSSSTSTGEAMLYSPGLGMIVPESVRTDDFSVHVRCVR